MEMRGTMRFNHLQVFRTIYETGGVTAAARELNTTQPPVTRMLRNFEASINVTLFKREKGRLVPTPEADFLYAKGHAVIEQFDGFKQVLQDVRSGRWQALTIGAALPHCITLLPPLLQDFSRRHPDLQIHVHTGGRKDQLARLESEQVDIAIVYEAPDRPNLRKYRLCDTGLVVILPTDNPLAARSSLSFKDISNETMINGPLGSPMRSAFDAFAGADSDITYSPVLTQSVALIVKFVAEGMGVCIIDQLSAEAFPTDRVAKVPLEEPAVLHVEAVLKSGRVLSVLEREFLNELVKRSGTRS